MTNPKGTPLWVAPWMEPLREFELSDLRPPVNAEYALHLFLSKEEQDAQIGDLIERYNQNLSVLVTTCRLVVLLRSTPFGLAGA
jgi:hypothetical protein